MDKREPFDVCLPKPGQAKQGVRRLTLQQLYGANCGHDLKEPHRLHFSVAILVTSGAWTHMVDFCPVPVKTFDLLLIRAGQVHSFSGDRSPSGEILLLTPEFLFEVSGTPLIAEPIQRFFEAGPRLSLSAESANSSLDWLQQFSDERAVRGKPYSDARITCALGLLVSRLLTLNEVTMAAAQQQRDKSNLAQEFKPLLEKNFLVHRDPAWYARQLHVSTRTLDRRLSESLNRTCKQLITTRLILEAKRLLTDPDLQIKEVGYSLGFDEIANFSRFFFHYAGVTAREFRRHRLER